MAEYHSFFLTHKKFFDAYRVTERGALAFLGALSVDAKSTYFSDLSKEPSTVALEHTEAVVRLEKKTIPFVVDPHQKAVLMRAWGDVFDISFTNSMKVGHPMPAAFRTLECEVLLSLCDHSQGIVDAGGNTSYHVRHNRAHVHSCCPLLDARDYTRMNSRALEIRRTARDKNSRAAGLAKRVLANPSLAYCNKKSEDCDHKAKTMLWVHSIYNMKLQNLAEQMVSHDAEVGHGVFMYTDAVLEDDEGVLSETGATFSKAWVEGIEKIRFFFIRDPSFAYEHNWKNYREFLVDKMITHAGKVFYYRVYPTRRNSMMFTVTRLNPTNMTSVMSKQCVITRSRKPKVAVTVYEVDWSKAAVSREFVKAREVKIPAEFYHGAMAFCFAKMRDDSEATPLDFNAFYLQCRTLNKYMDINGVAISGAEKVGVEDFNLVCISLFHLAAMIVAYRRIHTGLVVRDMQKKRSLATQGFFCNFFRYCKTFLPNMVMFKDMVDRFRMVLIQKVDNDLLSVLVEEEARYTKVNTMCLTDAFEQVSVDYGHTAECDLGDDWKANDDDLELMADMLRAEGKDGQAEVLEKSRSSLSTPSSTYVDSTAGCEEDEDKDYFKDDMDDVPEDKLTPEYKMQVTGRRQDPTDRVAANAYRIAAIDEYVKHCRATYEKDLASARTQMAEAWNPSTGTPAAGYCQRKVNSVEAPNFILFDGKAMLKPLIPMVQEGYMWGLDPRSGQLVKMYGGTSKERGGILKANYKGWLFVCHELSVLNGHLIADAIEREIVTLGGYGELPTVYMSAGVAGSGKSTRIQRQHQAPDMIFTATAGCVVDMRTALQPGGKSAPQSLDYTEGYLRSHVLTNHSYLINATKKTTVIRHDEAVLAHVGELYAVAMKCGAKVVYWSGDAVQIPFLNRISSIMKTEYATIEYFDHYEEWNKSYRMPHDTTKAANKIHYNGKAKTCSSVVQSMSLTKISDATDERFVESLVKADLAMGFYKSEKADVKKKTKRDIAKTVHESQGADFAKTVLCRFNDKDFGGLYNGPKLNGLGHVFVGCSRHKESLQIFHRGPVDGICEFVEAGSEPAPLDSYIFNPEIHKEVEIYF